MSDNAYRLAKSFLYINSIYPKVTKKSGKDYNVLIQDNKLYASTSEGQIEMDIPDNPEDLNSIKDWVLSEYPTIITMMLCLKHVRKYGKKQLPGLLNDLQEMLPIEVAMSVSSKHLNVFTDDGNIVIENKIMLHDDDEERVTYCSDELKTLIERYLRRVAKYGSIDNIRAANYLM